MSIEGLAAARDTDVRADVKLLLLAIGDHACEQRMAQVSMERLMDWTSMSDHNVLIALQIASRANLIEAEEGVVFSELALDTEFCLGLPFINPSPQLDG